tara:strand:+ start:3962 stop:4633 length:672 start_codon:yes stop_codon:yes gene_type:complete
MKKSFYLILLFLLINLKVEAKISIPENSTLVVISDGMLVDGLKMKAWEFKSNNSLDDNIAFFTDKWESKSDVFTQKKLNEWDVVNAVIDGVIYTAKLRSVGNKGTFGYLGTSEKPDDRLKKLSNSLQGFPMPNGTTVMREIKSEDGGKISNTMILDNNLSVKRNLNFYNKYYTKYNWAIDKVAYTKQLDNGVFIARNGPNNVNITFMRQKGRTFITAVREDVK